MKTGNYIIITFRLNNSGWPVYCIKIKMKTACLLIAASLSAAISQSASAQTEQSLPADARVKVSEWQQTHPGKGPVPVREEPRHHNVFENEWVRVLDVRIPPGDTTMMHIHHTPSVFMVMTATKTGSQSIVEPNKPSFNNGHIWFEWLSPGPRVHRVWNSDTTEFHVIDMELVHWQPRPSVTATKTSPANASSIFEEPPASAWHLTDQAGQQQNMPAQQTPSLLVCLSDLDTPLQILKKSLSRKGDFVFIPAGTAFDFTNKNASEVTLAYILFH